MKKTALKIEFNTEILWLRRYFKRSTANVKLNQIEQMVADRQKKGCQLDDNLIQIYQTWQRVIADHIERTDYATLQVIRAVFVHNSMSVSGAGDKYLHYSRATTYRILYKWFEALNIAYFNAR